MSPNSISPRERQVLQLIADGITAQGVAAIIGCSTSMVRSHIDQLKRKLGARNRSHLVALAMRFQGAAL